MRWYEDFITRTEGVQGGEPIVRGTRTPVRTIVALYFEVYPDDPARAQASLPHLTGRQIEAALAYYADHRAEIDRLIAEHRRIVEELAATS